LLDKKCHKSSLATSENKARSVKPVMSILKGEAIRVTPKMHVVFMKQLPTIFLKARPRCPSFVAFVLVASSGALVPIATTVAPMTTGGVPKMRMICEAELTGK